MKYCQCVKVLSLREGVGHLKEEVTELLEKPSLDELSDCSWAIGRLLAGLFGRVYASVPFDGRHRQKIEARMKEHGCVRSRRHLVGGQCPSTQNEI